MRFSFYSLLIFMFPLFSFGQEWNSFTDTAGNFTAKYPPTWINKVKEGNRIFFTSPLDSESNDFRENINISVTAVAGYRTDITVRSLFPNVSDALKKQFNDYKEESFKYFMWNNIEAAEIIYSGFNKLDESLRIRSTQWFCFYKHKLYIATFVSEATKNNHTETAFKIMESVIFK